MIKLRLAGMAVAVLMTLFVLPTFARSSHKIPIEELEFKGHYRIEAKTSYAPGPTEQCANVAEVITTLVTDERMRKKYPKLGDKETKLTMRVDQELRNVCVEGYLYAVKFNHGRHGNNDFQLIIGSHSSGKARFLAAEVSGVPRGGNKSAFIKARRQLLTTIGKLKLRSGYKKLKKPIKVRVEGSLYFDAGQRPGQSAPRYAKPATVWEIRPVKTIQKIH